MCGQSWLRERLFNLTTLVIVALTSMTCVMGSHYCELHHKDGNVFNNFLVGK